MDNIELQYKQLCFNLLPYMEEFVDLKKKLMERNVFSLKPEEYQVAQVEYKHLGKLLFDVLNNTSKPTQE